MTLTHQRSAED